MEVKDCVLHGDVTRRLVKTENEIKDKVEMSLFKWVVGILITLFILYSGITLGTNNEAHKELRLSMKESGKILDETAKQMAVLTDMVIRHVVAMENDNADYNREFHELEKEVAHQKEKMIEMSTKRKK